MILVPDPIHTLKCDRYPFGSPSGSKFSYPILYAPNYKEREGFLYCQSCQSACNAHEIEIPHREGCLGTVQSYGFGPNDDFDNSPQKFAKHLYEYAISTIKQDPKERKTKPFKAKKMEKDQIYDNPTTLRSVLKPIHFMGQSEILACGSEPIQILYAPKYAADQGFWFCHLCKNARKADLEFFHQHGCKGRTLNYGFGPKEKIYNSPLPIDLAKQLFATAVAKFDQESIKAKRKPIGVQRSFSGNIILPWSPLPSKK